ncbi:MAG: hypothetical protein ACLSB9_35710 [Hydrogeniiclostridium mannosilyticum]
MLKSGKYIAEHDNGIFDRYRIVMSVKETEKSYIFELLEYVSRYSPAQMDMLFDKSKRVKILKSKGGHAMRIWSDMTLHFIHIAGIPFHFERVNEGGSTEGSGVYG